MVFEGTVGVGTLEEVLAELGALAERVQRGLDRGCGRRARAPGLEDALARTRRLAAGLRAVGSMTHDALPGRGPAARPVAHELPGLARAVAHELRSPLQALGLSLGVLRLERAGDSALERQLDGLEASMRRARALVRSIHDLTVAEVARACARLAWLGPALARVVHDLEEEARQAGVELVLDPPAEDAPPILVEAILLHVVVANVAGNSIKYHDPAKPRRRVRIATRLADDVPAGLPAVCEIVVADDGLGIAPEHLPRVLERGFRGRPEHAPGTGLGLHIVERALASRGGSIEISSRLGEGTTVTMRLPSTPTS